MKRWPLIVGVVALLLIVLGAGGVALYFVIYGSPSLSVGGVVVGEDPLERALDRWRMGEFRGYDRLFHNPGRFEEVLFLNFLRGNLTLSCDLSEGYLKCDGFAPIRVKRRGSRYEIVSSLIYLTDSSSSLGRRRKRLADWVSKLKNMPYYDALEVCVGQMRDRTEADSLYLERKAYENDTLVLSKLRGVRMNVRFYELFEDRMLDGHVCLPYTDVLSAHRRFRRFVRAEEEEPDIGRHLRRKREALKKVTRELEERLVSMHDPLALAFYKRGLQYYSKGDLESARIFFKKALKIDPKFEQAKKALERVELLIERGEGSQEGF